MNPISRRTLLRGSAAVAAAGSMGVYAHPAKAANRVAERKILTLFASGGWSAVECLSPGPPGVDLLKNQGITLGDEGEYLGRVGNLQFTANDETMPDVTRFFQRWGGRSAIVTGVDAHSVGHDSATQFMLTGTSASSFPDWPTAAAANSRNEYPLPHLVFSGPSFPGTYGATVVRAGGGTLLDLIDGSIVGQADDPAVLLSTPADSMVDAFVHKRVAKFLAERPGGLGEARAKAMLSNLERAMELEGRRFEAGLDDLGSQMVDQMMRSVELFRLGLARSAMVSIPGGWDTHGGDQNVAQQFNDMFIALEAVMDHMAQTPGMDTEFLIDEVTIVCMSEFGRTPVKNGANGRDHWPYGAALVAGSGVAGNRVIGETDEGGSGVTVDFSTGAYSSSGSYLGCENVGCTLLKMMGVASDQLLPDVQLVDALMKG